MLEWTGERFLPWIRESTIAYEHLHRYAYAAKFVKGKRVLDLASGEGYGASMLAADAAFVAGVDIDESAIRHASEKYAGKNLKFLAGPVTAVPIQDNHSFDVIVCFEAIEHIERQEELLSEVERLLTPDGVFIVSTPNKAVYDEASPEANPFHVKELSFEEFQNLLARRFRNVRFLGQHVHPGSSIWPIAREDANGFHEFVIERRDTAGFDFIDPQKRVPLYFIAIASNAFNIATPEASVLLDQSDSLLQEKQDELQASAKEVQWREQQVAEREETIRSLEEGLRWRENQISNLTESLEEANKGLAWMRTEAAAMQNTIAAREEALAWRAQQVSDLEMTAENLQKAKEYWEQESLSATAQLQNTQRQLAAASDTLAGIYASRGWKLILKLRRIRDVLMGRAKPRA